MSGSNGRWRTTWAGCYPSSVDDRELVDEDLLLREGKYRSCWWPGGRLTVPC